MGLFSRLKTSLFPPPRPRRPIEKEEVTATRNLVAGLSVAKVNEIFEVIQTREVLPRLPSDFADGLVGHFLFSGSALTSSFRGKGAKSVLVTYLGPFRLRRQAKEQEFYVQASPERLPYKEWICRWVLLSAPTLPATPMARLIKELGRVIEPGGGGIIVDWHPYSSVVQETLKSRPVTDEREGVGFEKYFKALQQSGLIATQVKEIFVDGVLRSLMETTDEKEWYNAQRRKPLALLLIVKKQKHKT